MYKVMKLKLSTIISNEYDLKEFSSKNLQNHLIMQQDNSIFRHINKINNGNKLIGIKKKYEYIEDIIFVNINKSVTMAEWQIQKKKEEYRQKYLETGKKRYAKYIDGKLALTYILKNGFKYKGVIYKRFGKSSSMARNASIAFVSEKIFNQLFDITTMGIDLKKPMVLSKFEAYRGLLFSSSEVIQNELPYIVLVNDLIKCIPNQQIKYTIEEDSEYISKHTGEVIKTKKYPIYSGIDDVEISCFDGMGCHEKDLGDKIEKVLGERYPAIQIRAPYMKGLSVEFSFRKYFKEVLHQDYIIDINNVSHNIDEVDCIYPLSMWKGNAYFDNWDKYKTLFNDYNHEFCVSKYARLTKDETLYTRANFQYLQSLTNLNKQKILELSEYSKQYVNKIISGDLLYSLLFLGLINNIKDKKNSKIDNYFMEAVKINPIMLNDKAIQRSLYNLLKKTINGFKLGRLFVNAHYSMVYGDIKLFMEHVARVANPEGVLKNGEFYSPIYEGIYAGFRSPLIHKSEVNRMNFIKNKWLETWCSHLDNLIMLNGYDISMPRMGGMDLDGDSIWVTNNITIYSSIEDEDVAVVVDKDDKSSSEKTIYNIEQLIEYERRTLSQRIGDITNKSTGLTNQTPSSDKSKKYIDDQNVFLRVAQGHEIDSIKTGTKYVIAPYYNSIKLPYFLIYRYPKEKAFYKKIKKENAVKKKNGQEADRYNVSMAKSSMNELAWDIEKWEIEILKGFNNVVNNDTYKLLMDNNTEFKEDEYLLVKEVYKKFNNDYINLLKEHKGDKDINKWIMSLYDNYKLIVNQLNINKSSLVNYCVLVSYIKDEEDITKDNQRIKKAEVKGKVARIHNKSSKFAWVVVPEIMLDNLRNNSDCNKFSIIESDDGEEYLGRKYKIVDVDKENLIID